MASSLARLKARFRGALTRSLGTGSLVGLSLASVSIGIISGLQQMLDLGTVGTIFFRAAGLVAILVIATCAIVFATEVARFSLAPPPIDFATPPSRFYCRVLDSFADSETLNRTAVAELFAGTSPSLERAMDAQRANNRRLIGILSKDTDEIAGWVAMWPVKAAVARQIEAGTLADDEIPIDQIVRRADNRDARYLAILAVGIREQYRCLPEKLFPKLVNAALWHIHDEFFADDDKPLRIIAVAYSDEGERMCRGFGLSTRGQTVTYSQTSEQKSVYAGDFRREDIRAKLRSANG